MQVHFTDHSGQKPACAAFRDGLHMGLCAGRAILSMTSSTYRPANEPASDLVVAALQGSSSPADAIAAIRQGTSQMLGVTLAGWLVLEQDITPSLWAGVGGAPVGEAALMQAAATQVCLHGSCQAAVVKAQHVRICMQPVASSAGSLVRSCRSVASP